MDNGHNIEQMIEMAMLEVASVGGFVVHEQTAGLSYESIPFSCSG